MYILYNVNVNDGVAPNNKNLVRYYTHMLLTLIRKAPEGQAVRGELYLTDTITGNGSKRIGHTLENTDYLIPELIYPVQVTYSPRFDQPLPLVQRVPRSADDPKLGFRTGIRFHNGYLPRHSQGCVLLLPDSPMRQRELTTMLSAVQADGEGIWLEVKHKEPSYELYDVPCPKHERMR